MNKRPKVSRHRHCDRCGRTLPHRQASRQDEALAEDIRSYLDDLRDQMDIEDMDMGPAFQDDEVIVSNSRIEDWVRDGRGERPGVIFTFDGDAYDFFGLNARFPKKVDQRFQDLMDLADQHGYRLERMDNVSIGFYEK